MIPCILANFRHVCPGASDPCRALPRLPQKQPRRLSARSKRVGIFVTAIKHQHFNGQMIYKCFNYGGSLSGI